MEATVARWFTNDVRNAAAGLFRADSDKLELLGDFESYVFGYECEGVARVLRITHPSHRSADQIDAEVDWVEHIASHGVRLSRPHRSRNDRWTETVGEGEGIFHVCSFERMPGHSPTKDDWTPELFRKWGKIAGRIHRLSREYKPSAGIVRRLRWDEDPYYLNGRSWIPDEADQTREKWDELYSRLAALPEDPQAFGICHTDLHQDNFLVHEGEIQAFDTDDCGYHWFLEDLSSILFYSRGHAGSGDDRGAFARWAWPEIWRGYREEYDLATDWLDHLELFLQIRRITLYALVQMKFGPEEEIVKRWAENRHRIDRGESIFPVDLRELAESSSD